MTCDRRSGRGPTTIAGLLDGVEWERLSSPPDGAPTDLPVATHSGVLQIGDVALRVYQLSNGHRVIDEADLAPLFGLKRALDTAEELGIGPAGSGAGEGEG